MAGTGNTPSWLNEADHAETEWAANYLSRRCPEPLKKCLSSMASTVFSSLVRSIHALENEAEGVRFIERLRNAIRQRRYRLVEGGRKTCSFTLPKATKAALKILAKRHKTTETALIERLINGALLAAQDQKEEKRRETITAKITRNSSKLAHELNGVRIEEANKHLKRCLKQLAIWELFYEGIQPGLPPEDDPAANERTEKRMREIQEAIGAAVAKREYLSPRSLVDA
jgi:hypothetical protein